MRKETERLGVVAELDGKYWGVQYADGYATECGFGPIEKANISDERYCTLPEHMTYKDHYKIGELRKATLRPITVTTIYEVD